LRKFRDIAIRGKLIIIMMISSLGALILASGILIIYDNITTRESIVRKVQVLADVTALNCTAALSFNSKTDATETLSALRAEKHILSARVYDKTGQFFAEYERNGQLQDTFVSQKPEPGHRFDKEFFTLTCPILLEQDTIGAINLTSDLSEISARNKKYASAMGIIVIASSLVALFLLTRLQNVITVPILQLAEVARGISERKDYSLRARLRGDDEVGFLISTFNKMIEQIQQRDLELKNAHDELEHRVVERTMDLQAEVNERRRAEDRIKSSLIEKEMLLKEIHHRVKNNLQIIVSLLNLQARNVEDETTRELFLDSQSRVKSMALIHERLYRSNNLAEIEISDYIHNLLQYFRTTLVQNNLKLSITENIESFFLGVDEAVPCGLIITELMTNALKHAFIGMAEGTITVMCRNHNSGTIELSVADNGKGLPKDFNIENSDSLGMTLVTSLSNQLNGKLDIKTENGTKVTLMFGQQKLEKEQVPVAVN
jgi:two-component sensor histidine kinase/uncharacterized membrane protein affecting hemolysin expression